MKLLLFHKMLFPEIGRWAGAMTCLLVLLACTEKKVAEETINAYPALFPDYADVTIPCNIAPLNFCLEDAAGYESAVAQFVGTDTEFEVEAKSGDFTIPANSWKKLLTATSGSDVQIRVMVKVHGRWQSYLPFRIHVATEPIDSYLAYRLIEPGYALWNQMGIYQRNLESFEETAIYENKMTNYNCVNCHSFCMQSPDKMLFHLRSSYSGTLLADGGKIQKLNTKTDRTLSPLVYPSWHPSGKFIAFSVNQTTQGLHAAQRVEVYDKASDVVVYDVERQEIVTAPQLSARDALETFPSFSADGKTLYYCSAPAYKVPDSLLSMKYSLCAVSFDAGSRTFGNSVDTLYNASEGRSVSFPRVSPDGKFLLCTMSAYGTFPIWHKEADLYLIDLASGRGRFPASLNSEGTESYHSWSSNSRWVVFSSRRLDGLYTHPFIAYVNEQGETGKPFLLPQKETGYYDGLMKSFNIPEFVRGKVKISSYEWMEKAKSDGDNVKFSSR